MLRRLIRTLVLTIAVAVCLAANTVDGLLAQVDKSSPPKKETWARTPDGQPDIQGYFQVALHPYASVTLERLIGMRYSDLGISAPPEERGAADAPDPDAAGIIIDPVDGRIPYLPWARAKKEAVLKSRLNPTPETMDPVSRCLPPSLPRAYFVNRSSFQILQPPGYVVFLFEYESLYRAVPLKDAKRSGQGIREWAGESRGHWDGNTLVIEVTNFNERSWLDLVGDFHSDLLHIVERWRFDDLNGINYEATFDDPKVFARPWTIAHRFNRNQTPEFELMEFACWEGERNAAAILKGGQK
jgi:hypothetical protein